MIIGTILSQVLRSMLQIAMLMALHPWSLIKIAILWFFVSIAVTFGYFLWTHQDYILKIRSELVFKLFVSLVQGLFVTVLLIGFYEFILQMLCLSKLFLRSKNLICNLSLTIYPISYFFKIVGTILIGASTYWACHFIEPFLEQWYDKNIVHGYGWLMIITSVVCVGFLWVI